VCVCPALIHGRYSLLACSLLCALGGFSKLCIADSSSRSVCVWVYGCECVLHDECA
jgi:hypothetical protein